MSVSRARMLVVSLMLVSCIVALVSSYSMSAELPQVSKELTFAVIPQGPPEVMQSKWLPFIDRLSRDTGLVLKLKLYEEMDDFEDDLRKGSVDFACLNPVQQIMAWNANGYIPLARSRQLIAGSIFVRKDSEIKSLKDLERKEIAFIGPRNVCSIVLRHELEALKISAQYVGSSSNVYKRVAIGDTAAGGTLDIAFEEDTSQVKQVLQPIYTTEPLSPHPISAHPSVGAKTRGQVIEAVLSYWQDKSSQAILRAIRMQDPVAADYDRDYKPLEQRLTESSNVQD